MSRRIYIPDPAHLRYPDSQAALIVRISPALARALRALLGQVRKASR